LSNKHVGDYRDFYSSFLYRNNRTEDLAKVTGKILIIIFIRFLWRRYEVALEVLAGSMPCQFQLYAKPNKNVSNLPGGPKQ